MLILDLDNTCWGGVIGDDGLVESTLEPKLLSPKVLPFQNFVSELKDRGISLAFVQKMILKMQRKDFLIHQMY